MRERQGGSAAARLGGNTARRLSGSAATRLGAAVMAGTILCSRPEMVQAQRAVAAEIATAGVWDQLNDSTLTRLIAEVLAANPDIQSATARIRGARAARLSATLDFVPTVTAAGGFTRQRLAGASFPIGGGGSFPDQSIWDAGFDASWEVDLFGRVRKNVKAQGQLVDAAREDLRNVQVSLAAEVARAYFELRGAQEQLAVATRNAENQRNTLQVTQDRLDAGTGTAFDTERAKAQLSSTLAVLPTFQAQVAAAQYRIGVLAGRSPVAVAVELGSAAPLPSLPGESTLALSDSVIQHRPDVRAAERELAASRSLVGSAKSEYLPKISVGGQAGFTSSEFSDLGGDGTFRYAVGPVISWPALNLGRVKARVDASQAVADESQARYRLVVLEAEQEIQTGLVRFRTANERVAQLGEAAAASERAAELARIRFNEGVTDFLQVLDAERTQLEAQRQLVQARTDAATAYAALVKALGGR
jgi:NodT family efflux transporter outer membrane factor (OMF) lipoprotein